VSAARKLLGTDRFERDDLLDALAAAVTAQRGWQQYLTIPAAPPEDTFGLPMEMVYWCGAAGNENGNRPAGLPPR
jgi:predicted RNase H-like nuclease